MKRGWEIYRIGDFCDVKTGKLDANASSADGTYPFFTYSKEPLRIETYSYDAECVLVAGNGDLNVKYYKGKFDAYQRTYIITLKEHIKNISVKYLYKFFLLYVETLRSKSIGGVIKYIKLGDITNAKIMIPPIVEQERIVGELDCLSGIIAAKRAQLRELDTLAQSIFYTMFGDPITNDKGWQTKIVGEICIHKKHIQRANKVFLPTSKIKYIDISSIDNTTNHIVLADEIIFSDAPSRAQQKVKYGDILISLVRPNLKNIAVLNYSYDNLVASSGFCILRTESTVVNKYYMLYVILYNSFTKYLMDRTSGANYPAVREDDIKQCKISVPPIDLQNEFAEKIESIERQKELITKSIKETEDLFNSRMSYYFD